MSMSRIRKIVERGKLEKAKSGKKVDEPLEKRANITANNRTFEYTVTRRVDVPDKTLWENRLISQNRTDPRSTPFQMLRTRTLQQMRKKSWTTLAITAPTPGAGKSLVSANLAASIASEGNQSVLLVDMDLRKPSIHGYFGLDPEYGIHDYLDGSTEVEKIFINPGIERLVVLPGRKGVINSSEQISTPFVQNFVAELRNRYQQRLVIFDLPPVLVSDDVMVFLPYVDCSLLVVESGKNTQKEVENSLAVIGNNPLLGTVLNKSEKSEKSFIY